jgi:hypothetical protein
MIVLVNNNSAESAFGMRIPDADLGDQNHADPCGCGPATFISSRFPEELQSIVPLAMVDTHRYSTDGISSNEK